MKNSALKTPSHLKPDTRTWWVNWRLKEHHARLLTLLCEAWGRCQQAREIMAKDGIVIGGREAAVRPHPCIAIERDSRIAFSRLLGQLNLDGERRDRSD